MSNNKQSSIEWLEQELKKIPFVNVLEVFEQAKAMHKKECVDLLNTHNDIFDTSEDHYNQTFGGNN